jgi:hypothetical protein
MGVIVDDLDRQLGPLEPQPLARATSAPVADEGGIPGVAELLGRTQVAADRRHRTIPSARKLVGRSGLTPEIKQSGQSHRQQDPIAACLSLGEPFAHRASRATIPSRQAPPFAWPSQASDLRSRPVPRSLSSSQRSTITQARRTRRTCPRSKQPEPPIRSATTSGHGT